MVLTFKSPLQADGAKVATKERALSGHAPYGYTAGNSGVFGEDYRNRLSA